MGEATSGSTEEQAGLDPMTITRVRHGAFISYARADGEAAARDLQARLALEAPDVPAWLDRLEVEGGVGWWNQIEQQLDRAEFLLLVMTPAAIRSENTTREWRNARQRGVCVYPIKGVSDSALDYGALPNWMRKAHFYDAAKEWPNLLAHLRRGCVATRVPFMAPPLPASFVPRPRETDALIGLLRTRGNDPVAITTALRGAGGFGKTTLAAAICHDDRILDAYDDGILWVTLGQTPNLLNEFIKLFAALTGERPGFVDVEDAARELALKLEHKNCLIVIDDAWNASHAAPFLRGGPGCARLLTTRLFEVAAEASRVDVDQMQPAEAVQLLLARAAVDHAGPEPFDRLAARLGEWPLAIKLAGSAIRQRIERGEPVANALDYVTRALDKRGITAFDKDHPSAREDAVTRTVGASLDLLSADDQRRCVELTIFPEDASIPLAAAMALWQLDEIDSEDLARRLDDLALMEFDLRSGTLRMHDVLRAYLASLLPDDATVHGRLVDAWGDPSALAGTYAWRRYTYHLRRAGRMDRLRALLLDPTWIAAKLRATDVHSLITDYEQGDADRVLDLVRDTLRLSAAVITADPNQTCAQLAGRLLSRDEPEIVGFREDVRRAMRTPWLRLVHPTLDAPGGMLLMTLVGHEREVTSIAADDDQQRLFSASNDSTVAVWDLREGRLIRTFGPHRNLGARAVAVSADGELAISGGADGLVYLWDVVKGERIDAFRRERGLAVTSVAISADRRIAISGSREHTVRVWDIEAGVLRSVLGGVRGHREQVTSVAITADARRALSGSDDCTIRVWDLESRGLEWTLEGHAGPVNAVAMSPDGRHGLSGSSDRSVKLWDLRRHVCLRTLSGHTGSVTAVALAAQAWRAISGSSDQTARLWDLHTGEVLSTLEGHADSVNAVLINQAGTRAATASTDRAIKVWRLDDLRSPTVLGTHAGAVVSVVFSPDGHLCASGGSDGRVIIREAASARVIRTIDAHTAPVRSLAFTADGNCVLSGGVDNRYWLWTIETGEGTWIPVRHAAPIDYCALSATARYLITSCADRYVYLWDVPSGAALDRYGTRRLFDHVIAPSPRRRAMPDADELRDEYFAGEAVYEVMISRMSRDGRHAMFSAVARDADRMTSGVGRERGPSRSRDPDRICLLVLDVATGEVHSISAPQGEAVTAFSIDAAAERLLWARSDHALELWDLDADVRVAAMRGHTDKVNAIAFTRDGSRAISCGRDRSARAWSLSTGQALAAFTADSALRSLALSPDDDTVAVGDVAGRVHFLRLESP